MATCEILSVGTELLLGQILNTNSQYLSEELALLGINCFFQTTVGDNKPRIIDSIKNALNRCDVLLITGGLGPTADDLTTECLAETFAVPLVFDEAVMQRIENLFHQRGYPMPQTNRKQALRPENSQVLDNPSGTAPGIVWDITSPLLQRAGIQNPETRRLIMTFPGVPSEMKVMWKNTAVPLLVERHGQQTFWSCELKHYGIGESALAEKFAHLLELHNPTVAPYAGAGECRLRITARADSRADALELAVPILEEIRRTSGTQCYGTDADTLESVTGALLMKKKLVLAIAESCTGGLVSKRLTDVSGSSAYVKLNVVTYADEMKHRLLGVEKQVLARDGAVSRECAIQMAGGIRQLSQANIGLSITGIAGPSGGTTEKPVGLVYLALDDGKEVLVNQLTLPSHLPRDQIRWRAANEALNMVRLRLLA